MMLAHSTETPRPRPPAKVRRSSAMFKNVLSTPPPSYAFAADGGRQPRSNTLLGSPVSATLQMLSSWDGDAGTESGQDSPPMQTYEDADWTNERSREELSELLVKAEDLIKERETELGLTSAACKNLYANNVALKRKHQALLGRIPRRSPSWSAASPTPSMASIYRSPSLSNGESLSRSSSDPALSASSSPQPQPTFTRGHGRKVSVSPTDIFLLADQNAELMQKVEKLESDSSNADHSGRRVLKRLEKEIAVLREELEKTQAKSEELEEKTRGKFGWGSDKAAEEVIRKKKEREERVKAMRYNPVLDVDDEESGDSEVRNFAPDGSLFGGSAAGFSFAPTAAPSLAPRTPVSPSIPRSLETPIKELPIDHSFSAARPEMALISQLLVKIQELEETNIRIMEQQSETSNQLQAVQRETDHISSLYECLTDQNAVHLELVTDGVHDFGTSKAKSADETIRFRSFKRNLESGSLITDSLNGDKENQPANTTKARKSVLGLFDGSGSSDSNLARSRLPVPFASSPYNEGYRSAGSEPNSPALSCLSLSSTPRSQASDLSPTPLHPTLEAELGNEFKGAWGLNGGDHHLRTDSLNDLTRLSPSPSPTGSPSPSGGHSLTRDSSYSFLLSPSAANEAPALPTPMSMVRLSVEPPTPEKLKDVQARSAEQQSVRYKRMSQTVRSRTNQWVDGRFTHSLSGMSKRPILSRTSSSSSDRARGRLSTVFSDVVGNFGLLSNEDPDLQRSDDSDAIELYSADSAGTQRKKNSFVSFMMGIWLWLQFGIIIMLFLWTMAKRGPKSVLGEVDKKRVVSPRH